MAIKHNGFSDITYDELTNFIKPINNNIEVPLNEINLEQDNDINESNE